MKINDSKTQNDDIKKLLIKNKIIKSNKHKLLNFNEFINNLHDLNVKPTQLA